MLTFFGRAPLRDVEVHETVSEKSGVARVRSPQRVLDHGQAHLRGLLDHRPQRALEKREGNGKGNILSSSHRQGLHL